VTDFGRAQDMIDAGYRATAPLDPRLARCASRRDAGLAVARSPGQRTPVITAIKVENDSKVSDDVIRYYIRQPIGEPLNSSACRPTWARCTAWITSTRCNTAWCTRATTTPW
jgi:NTE family protein